MSASDHRRGPWLTAVAMLAAALAVVGCGSTEGASTTGASSSPTPSKPAPALHWTLEGVHAARKLGGDTLPTRAKHTFVVVKLRVRASRTVMLDPLEFVHLLVGPTEYRYSQPGYAAVNASTGDRLFFDDTLHAGRVVHGQAVFDVPLREHMALSFDNGQRIALQGVH
jgi:hypothetical protein